MEKNLLSIIIPVYNVEQYIEKCLESVVHQNYFNFEVIVIDDGSTDGSGNICDLYAAKYSNIQVYHIENQGLSMARNIGISKAVGEYVAFLDSDDYIDYSMYSKCIEKMKEEKAQCVFCKIYEVQPNGEKKIYNEGGIYTLCEEPQNQFPLFEQYPWEKTQHEKSSKSMLKSVWRSVYLRSIIADNFMQFDKNAKWGEDALFLTEYLSYCTRCAFVEEPLYYYVKRQGSLVNQYKQNFVNVRKYLYEKESKLILKNKYHSIKEKKYLLNELKLINLLAIVLNEVGNDKEGYNNLKKLENNLFIKSLITWSCVFQSMSCDRPLKHLVFILLVKMHAWKIIIRLYKKI